MNSCPWMEQREEMGKSGQMVMVPMSQEHDEVQWLSASVLAYELPPETGQTSPSIDDDQVASRVDPDARRMAPDSNKAFAARWEATPHTVEGHSHLLHRTRHSCRIQSYYHLEKSATSGQIRAKGAVTSITQTAPSAGSTSPDSIEVRLDFIDEHLVSRNDAELEVSAMLPLGTKPCPGPICAPKIDLLGVYDHRFEMHPGT